MSLYGGQRITPAFEILVGGVLVMAAGAFIANLYFNQLKKADEGVLIAQLRAFRLQQKIFTIVHHRQPADLKELVADAYSTFPMGAHDVPQQPGASLVDPEAAYAAAVDEHDFPVDPWGNRYVIDAVTNRIHSVTDGYEKW